MNVTVRLFAVLADIADAKEIDVKLRPEATGKDLLEAVVHRFPDIGPLSASLRLAVNLEYASWDRIIRPGDEVALIPPVSGGAGEGEPRLFVEVTKDPLVTDAYQRKVVTPYCGAVALFVGVVREFTGEKRTVSLRYDAYKAMAEKEMARIALEMRARWPMANVAMGHRVGELAIGEASVVVAVATPHRSEAFEAARYGIDTLKERVPIWKKERWDDGEEWVGIHA